MDRNMITRPGDIRPAVPAPQPTRDDLFSMLATIEASDPDGGEAEPTDEDHARHRRWAIEAFGPDVWRTYAAGGWAWLGQPGAGYCESNDEDW